MYTFIYEHLKAKRGSRCTLLFTDIDSVCCHIKPGNFYVDMEIDLIDLDEYDTINFEKERPLY